MASKMMKLRVGVADDPSALQPSLNDCLAAMLEQAGPLVAEVLQGLQVGTTSVGSRRVASFQAAPIRAFILRLQGQVEPVTATFVAELTRLVYEGGGKDQAQAEPLRFEDLRLFADDQLDQSIEVARAQQEVAAAVDDTLPALDALISTMLGWRTIQPGLNPVRPDVFVRALQATLAVHVPDTQLREILLTPASGLMGSNLRKLYRELTHWLRSCGIEPAAPLGGRIQKGGGSAAPVTDTVAKTLLTLDKLRKLLAGDFDQPKRADFLHTVPASMALLQDMKGADKLVKKLEQRARPPAPPAVPLDMLAEPPAPSGATLRIGQQLGEEVVRLLFDNLADDRRLLPGLKRQLKLMEPAVQRLTHDDSRFFSDRNHPARQLLDRITQRSLAFGSEDEPGWASFQASVADASRWLDSKVVDAETFGELLDHLQGQWGGQDHGARHKREEAARALLHAEQRNLLAQKLALEFGQLLDGLGVADFIGDFLKGAWAQVVAEAKLSCADGSSDPYGYRALVDDLVWSVQMSSAQRGRARRLVQMIPGLLQRLREGLARIGYPPELTQRFFDHLITLHRAAAQEGQDPAAQAAADAAWAEPSRFGDAPADEVQIWLGAGEAQESGWFSDEGAERAPEHVASPEARQQEAAQAQQQAQRASEPAEMPAPAAVVEVEVEAATAPDAQEAAPAAAREELRIGTWVEILIKGAWVRAELTWSSPHATLFMFTSVGGAAHSMSRRTLDKLRACGHLRIVANRPVVDEALDQVAQAALKNSL
ncbi:MAG: hypothetical protein JWP65_3499 [Ramlibacter sp.]|uniref:DUF1631 family protein n=1 Tax=Ramlibacter sp. TaxID=1917967 RepID=UPI0026377A82|nr:DUF1631 family protein [Ramlibacter sp.]MDB5753078.1 hypothetical protein [Ramlibacter sp.]